MEVNGTLPNGDLCSTPEAPAIEVSPSESPVNGYDEDSSITREGSLSPPAIEARSAVTPGRKAMEALKKVCVCGCVMWGVGGACVLRNCPWVRGSQARSRASLLRIRPDTVLCMNAVV